MQYIIIEILDISLIKKNITPLKDLLFKKMIWLLAVLEH